jgi:hypothetical protein
MRKRIPIRVNPAYDLFLYNGRSFRRLNKFLRPMLSSPFDTLAQRIREEF